MRKQLNKIVLTLIVTLLSAVSMQGAVATTLDEHFCEPTNFLFGCKVLNTAGTYYDTLQTVAHTDSVVRLNLSYGTPNSYSYSASIVSGQTYLFGCHTLTTAGTYKDTVVNASGCDSIVTLTLTVTPPAPVCSDTTVNRTDSVEIGQTYLFGCQTLTTAGTYRDTLVRAAGCDSIVVLTFTTYTPAPVCVDTTVNLTDSVEVGQSYLFGCQTLTTAGTYRDTLVRAAGCDSIVVLTFTTYTPAPVCVDTTVNIADSVEVGQSYLFGCQTLTTAGTYRDTLVRAAGCDSIVVLTFTTYVPVVCTDTLIQYADSVVEGSSYLFGCKTLTAAGVYRDTIVTALGCDSVMELTLSFYPACVDTLIQYADSVVEGSSYLFGCKTLTAAGVYRDTIVTALGCDSIMELTLSFYPACVDTLIQYTDSVVEGSSYLFGCKTLTAAGVYRDTIVTALGCDSIMELTLSFYPACMDTLIQYADSMMEGQTYLFGCNTLTTAGVYRDTIVTALGCDSIIELTLTTYAGRDTVTFNIDTAICAGETFLSRLQTLTIVNDTVFQDTVHNAITTATLITDSVYNYTIHALQTVYAPVEKDTACAKELPMLWHGISIVAAGTYYATDTFTAGCDSVAYELQLTVQDIVERDTTTATICAGDSYTWLGHESLGTFATSGTYTDTAYYATGCDSVAYTLILDVRPEAIGDTTNATICAGDSYTWLGHESLGAITVAGTYYDTVRYAGTLCDSICYQLNLTVQTADTAAVETATICDGATYTWLGHESLGALTLAGTYYDTARYAGTLCDSIYYQLDLTVQTAGRDTTLATICAGDSYTWFGQMYNTTGTYYDTLNWSVTGCDSIYEVLILTVQAPVYADVEPVTICAGDSYTWPGHEHLGALTAMDIYRDTAYYTTGCDSVYYQLILTVQQPTYATVESVIICAGDSYTWPGHESLGALTVENIYYDTAHYAGTLCDSIYYELHLTVQQPIYADIEPVSVFSDELPYIWVGHEQLGNLTVSGTYYDTAYYTTGCDSIYYQLDLNVISIVEVTVNIYDTVCEGSQYVGRLTTMTINAGRNEWYDSIPDAIYIPGVQSVDSIYYYQVWAYTSYLPQLLDSMPHAVCGFAFDADTIIDAMEAELMADPLYAPNAVITWLIVDENGNYIPYDGRKMSAIDETVTFAFEVQNDCETLRSNDIVMTIERASADNRDEMNNLPAANLFNNWLLMINLKYLNENLNINPTEEEVHWYRIVGTMDDLTADPSTWDDEWIGDGYYYTIGAMLTGEYYARIDLAPVAEDECETTWRTTHIVCQQTSNEVHLLPNRVRSGEQMQLVNLNTESATSIQLYDEAGHMIGEFQTVGEMVYTIEAQGTPGVYMLRLDNEEQHQTLKYMIIK